MPSYLKDSHYKGAKTFGYGGGYQYPHDFDGGYVPQAYLPEGRTYYTPTRQGAEARIADRLEAWKQQFQEATANPAAKV